ncbi:MAG: alpha/beta hydrolase [Deltaproteobacteria bacterium]|nr:alpha/beta hydrolase [Deltaproteobacteria bacterium]
MPNVKANDIQIEYDTFGDSSSPPLLLIIGLSCQMIFWAEELCEQLARKGLYVIRFDNRDTGLSTKFEEADVPDVMKALGAIMQGETITVPYTLDDMADDAVGLLEALSIEKAHICGMSMGGMISQIIAIKHPSRVLSLISIYSNTGNPELPQPKPEAMNVFLTPPPAEREPFIEHTVNSFKILSGPGFPFDEELHRNLAARSYDRAFYPQAVPRQLVAIFAHGNRKPALANVTAPTLVIHGTDDPIIPVEGGKDTAEAIPGAAQLIIDGMGHDLPHVGGAWPQIIDAIVDHTIKVEAKTG